MPKFRKKPVVVEVSEPWFRAGDHPNVKPYRQPGVSADTICKHCGGFMEVHGWIDTLEGGHIVCRADRIITGIKGEHYPCKPDIFEATYDPVED